MSQRPRSGSEENLGAPTLADRLLSRLTVVRPGEGVPALLLALNVCLLLSAYYVLKPVREAWILAAGGAELKSYASLGQVALLSLVIPAYSWLVSRVRRARLIRVVTLIFVGCLGAFYVGAQAEFAGLGTLFYLWVGIFNLMVIAQFWAFASDLYSSEQGERLFPIVAFGASSGAVVGSQLTSQLVGLLGVPQMLLVSAGLLFCTMGLTFAAERAIVGRSESTAPPPPREPRESLSTVDSPQAAPVKPASAFTLVLRSPYLRWIAVLMLLSNWVNSTGEFLLGSFVQEQAARMAQGEGVRLWIGQFYSNFFFWVNLISAGIQLIFAPRFIRHWGVRAALLVLPGIALFGSVAMVFFPVLAFVRWTKTVENATDYSLNNTVRNALFLPLSSEEKYKAKQVVDTLFVRAGDVFSAGLVFLGLRVLALPLSAFAAFNAVLALVWLFVALRLGRLYQEKTAQPS